jgi:hypothetical protein
MLIPVFRHPRTVLDLFPIFNIALLKNAEKKSLSLDQIYAMLSVSHFSIFGCRFVMVFHYKNRILTHPLQTAFLSPSFYRFQMDKFR